MSNEIDFSFNKTSIESRKVVQNGLWKLVSANVKKHVDIYVGNKNNNSLVLPTLKYNFLIERHSSTAVAVILIPALLLLLLNLFTFYVNVLCWERIGLIGVSLFSQFNLLMLVSWYIPYSADTVASICKFFCDEKFSFLLILVLLDLFYRDSLIITAFILIESLALKKMSCLETPTPNWVEVAVFKIKNVKLTDIAVFKKFVNVS